MKKTHIILIGLLLISLILSIVSEPVLEGSQNQGDAVDANSNSLSLQPSVSPYTVDGTGAGAGSSDGSEPSGADEETLTREWNRPSNYCPGKCKEDRTENRANCQRVTKYNRTYLECKNPRICMTNCDKTSEDYDEQICDAKFANELLYKQNCRTDSDCSQCGIYNYSLAIYEEDMKAKEYSALQAIFNREKAEKAKQGIQLKFQDFLEQQQTAIESGGDTRNVQPVSKTDPEGASSSSVESSYSSTPGNVTADEIKNAINEHETRFHPEANGPFHSGYGPLPKM
jgi:hypothetical protein